MAISTFKGVEPVQDWSRLGESINSSIDRYAALQREKEAQEKREQKEREALYLQQAKVDPVYTASAYWQKKQGEQIQDFQNYLGQVYYRSKNKPTIQDLIDIENHKQALYGWQQNLNAEQQKYNQAVKEIEKDPFGSKYDKGHFEKRVNEWVNDGKLGDDLLLPPLIGDLKGYYVGKNWKGTKQVNVTDKVGRRTTVEIPMTDEEAKVQVNNDMFQNPAAQRTISENFSKLPFEEKKKYLDKYGDNAISEWNWDNNGKYAIKKDVKEAPAPKERGKVGGSGITGSINYENPSDSITLSLGKYRNVKGRKEDIPAKVDVWGGYSLPGSITGIATARDYFDMSTGERKKVDIGDDIIIKYPEIKYLPMVDGGDIAGAHTGYRDEKGRLRDGFKIKAVLITRTEQGESKGLELTPELKDKLITKNPRLASEIEKIPLEINPKGNEKAEQKTTIKNIPLKKGQRIGTNKEGRRALFQGNKFIKWID